MRHVAEGLARVFGVFVLLVAVQLLVGARPAAHRPLPGPARQAGAGGIIGLVSGLLVYSLAPEAEGHGTDTAVKAYHRMGGFIRARVAPIKAVASAITIGSGGSVSLAGDLALVGVAAAAHKARNGSGHSFRLALGSVAPVPLRSTAAEELLNIFIESVSWFSSVCILACMASRAAAAFAKLGSHLGEVGPAAGAAGRTGPQSFSASVWKVK